MIEGPFRGVFCYFGLGEYRGRGGDVKDESHVRCGVFKKV